MHGEKSFFSHFLPFKTLLDYSLPNILKQKIKSAAHNMEDYTSSGIKHEKKNFCNDFLSNKNVPGDNLYATRNEN